MLAAAIFGLIFGVSSVAGPLIGGAFTERATWRWRFYYMNLPIGTVAFVFLLLFLDDGPARQQEPMPIAEQIQRLDSLGSFCVPSVVSLILDLQWGGWTYPWRTGASSPSPSSDWPALPLPPCRSGCPRAPRCPPASLRNAPCWQASFFMLFLTGGMVMCVCYIPLWCKKRSLRLVFLPPSPTFGYVSTLLTRVPVQTTHGIDPVKSGVYTLSLVLSLVVASVMSAAVTQRIGYHVPSMMLSACFMAIGVGLMAAFAPTTASPDWIGYQFLVGFGVGLGIQTVGLAVQATLPKEDIPSGIAVTLFAQQLDGAVVVSVGQAILSGLLVSRLSRLPGLDAAAVVRTGATELRQVVPDE